MITSILIFLAGAFVGWNLPQPQWAKNLQEMINEKLANLW